MGRGKRLINSWIEEHVRQSFERLGSGFCSRNTKAFDYNTESLRKLEGNSVPRGEWDEDAKADSYKMKET